MDRQDKDRIGDRFTEAWRAWANRPPKLSSSEAAARVAARIAAERHSRTPQWYLAAAAAVLLAVTGATVLWRHERSVPSESRATVDQSRPLGKGEVLMWLDEQTPLYMTFQEPDSEPGKGDRQ